MNSRIVLFAVGLAVPLAAGSSASAASFLRVDGSGSITYRASGEASVWSLRVRSGRIRFTAPDRTRLRVVCVRQTARAVRPCARILRTGVVVVKRPVRFLIENSDFRLRIWNSKRYNLNVQGSGTVTLYGGGKYTLNGATSRFDRTKTVLQLESSTEGSLIIPS